MSRREFEDRVLGFLRDLCRRRKLAAEIASDTNLFDSKILDSVQFVELMDFLQVELGVVVPDRLLSVEYFLTPRIISESFGPALAVH